MKCFQGFKEEGKVYWTTVLENEDGTEVINISDYGFEWYKDNKLIREGLVEDREKDIEGLKEIGFHEVY